MVSHKENQNIINAKNTAKFEPMAQLLNAKCLSYWFIRIFAEMSKHLAIFAKI